MSKQANVKIKQQRCKSSRTLPSRIREPGPTTRAKSRTKPGEAKKTVADPKNKTTQNRATPARVGPYDPDDVPIGNQV